MLNNRFKLAGADVCAVCAIQLQASGLLILRCLITRGNCSFSLSLYLVAFERTGVKPPRLCAERVYMLEKKCLQLLRAATLKGGAGREGLDDDN